MVPTMSASTSAVTADGNGGREARPPKTGAMPYSYASVLSLLIRQRRPPADWPVEPPFSNIGETRSSWGIPSEAEPMRTMRAGNRGDP